MKLKISDIVIPGLVILTAVVGSLVTSDSLGSWYTQINLPSWTPAGSIIGAVWSVLYIMIALAGILIWRRFPRGRQFNVVAIFFLVNLGLNAGWSYLFFGANWLGWALLEAIIMAATILILIIFTWRQVRAAAWLLLPYLAWVSFASYLTYSVWQLNL